MAYNLYEHQVNAIRKLNSGSILCGEVGSGKSLTALSFFLENYSDLDLYIITTAKKRDSNDWQDDCHILGISVTVDSWNNISRYTDKQNSFFIFDEQRVVGYGTWVKSFLKIAKRNKWILLSATPGDTWVDYIPVFIANGFYRNKTDFSDQHIEYDRFSKFPKIKKYHNEPKLLANRDRVLVTMPMIKHTTRHRKTILSEFNTEAYARVYEQRWNVFDDEPIKNASELTQCLRRVVATDPDRIFNATVYMDVCDKLIVFYNYNYELEILLRIARDLNKPVGQWNGKVHNPIPDTPTWLYLVQYTAGAEGWNCTETNTMLFYSLNYSYRIMEQAEGRIDRLNTPFVDLEYYILSSKSKIDQDVAKAVARKKKFNAVGWARKSGVIF